jgi:hypothetical protein
MSSRTPREFVLEPHGGFNDTVLWRITGRASRRRRLGLDRNGEP